MDIVQYLAKVLTEDPDVIAELDATMNTPMNSVENVVDTTDISTNPAEMLRKATNDKDTITNRNRTKQQLDREQQREKQKMLSPQLRKLHRTLDKMHTGVAKNQQDTTDISDQSTELDRQMDTVATMMQQFEKNLL